MARKAVISPRQRYGERIRKEAFPEGMTAAYIARISGIPAPTVTTWRRDPGKMPAYQYLRILDALASRQQ